ncbi:hypothetical protein [Halalkalibacter krulwichiae]|uniref:Uncharacterized protein n=1 Tax=Halalkalibacter krulwichiae TaxID=199441 RepID=A0A1X9MIR5_9BACI|nr:hypothetical protein [Halalkalibacter krulwichiae]ARK32183.1 hypothetical protein BkAM31D_21320 [Halalkalibacter krulwichiae]
MDKLNLEGLKAFLDKVISKELVLKKISDELARIERSDVINKELNFFRDNYFVPIFGQQTYNFLLDILDSKVDYYRDHIENLDVYYELKLFESKHNFLITRAYNQFANPMGFMQLNNTFDNSGRFLIELVRSDGASVRVNMNYNQKVDMALGLLSQTINEMSHFSDHVATEKFKRIEKELLRCLESVKHYGPKQ